MDTPNTSVAPGAAPELTTLYQTVQAGARWFYWIAGLSIVNAVLAHSESKVQFVLGLAITQVVDYLMAQIAPGAKWFSLVFDVLLAGSMAYFGYKGGQAVLWALFCGLGVFLVDCALFGWLCFMGGAVNTGVVLGGVFRALALVAVFGSIAATRRLHALKAQLPAEAT
ncbi:MAG: hypothetical protein JSR82_06675 [Verrucomicrobia bacterium]|nr:hypothetical protein [Verrucomicrobiota bacterium]